MTCTSGRSWADFAREPPALGEPFFFSTKAPRLFWDALLGALSDIVLVFGRGAMVSPLARSLSLSTSVGIAVYEVLRHRRASAPRQ